MSNDMNNEEEIPKGMKRCSVCGKIFIPAYKHLYKDKKGNKVCSYTCARETGWDK